MVHCNIKIVQALVTQQMVVHYVPLSACILERVVISLAREVQPLDLMSERRNKNALVDPYLWVPKLISLEVQITLASEGMDQ